VQYGRRLSQLFRAQQAIPYNALEGGFMRFSPIEAVVAYDESLAADRIAAQEQSLSELLKEREALIDSARKPRA